MRAAAVAVPLMQEPVVQATASTLERVLLQEDELDTMSHKFHSLVDRLDFNMEWEARQAQLNPACCA